VERELARLCEGMACVESEPVITGDR